MSDGKHIAPFSRAPPSPIQLIIYRFSLCHKENNVGCNHHFFNADPVAETDYESQATSIGTSAHFPASPEDLTEEILPSSGSVNLTELFCAYD